MVKSFTELQYFLAHPTFSDSAHVTCEKINIIIFNTIRYQIWNFQYLTLWYVTSSAIFDIIEIFNFDIIIIMRHPYFTSSSLMLLDSSSFDLSICYLLYLLISWLTFHWLIVDDLCVMATSVFTVGITDVVGEIIVIFLVVPKGDCYPRWNVTF